MKYIYIFFFYLISGASASAQLTVVDTVPPYKKDPGIPDFIILQTDSTWFTKEQLPKYPYTAIVYFAPDCGHCQITVKELVANMDSLTNVFFVFVAYRPMEDIREFYKYYGLNKFSNVRMGRDPKYFVPSFYRVTSNPFVALYNQNGLLMRVFDPALNSTIEIPTLVSLVNKN